MKRSNFKDASEKGYSLIELLVVILIIAILACLLYLGFFEVVQRSRLVQQQTDLRDIAAQVQSYRINREKYPDDANPGISPSNDPLNPIVFPSRDGWIYDFDHFTVGCLTWVKVLAVPKNQPRIDPYLEPGIMGQWVKTGNNLSYTINVRKVC